MLLDIAYHLIKLRISILIYLAHLVTQVVGLRLEIVELIEIFVFLSVSV